MPEELTPELLDSIVSEGGPPASPADLPVAPSSMRFVSPSPPTPLPMGNPRDFMAPRMAPAPVDPLEGMRNQINATQFKTAQDALAAAMRFQYLRAFQRDIDSGVPADKALLKWGPGVFEKNPNAISGMMRERRLATPPSVFQGSNMPPGVVYGGRIAFPPSSSFPKPPLSTNVTEYFAPGTTNRVALGFDTGPQTRKVVPERKPGLTDAQLASNLPRFITAAEKELKSIGKTVDAFEDSNIENEAERKKAAKVAFDAGQARRAELQDDLKQWRAQRDSLVKPGAAAPVVSPTGAAPAATPDDPTAAILKEANDALKRRPDKRPEILKRLKDMGIEVK